MSLDSIRSKLASTVDLITTVKITDYTLKSSADTTFTVNFPSSVDVAIISPKSGNFEFLSLNDYKVNDNKFDRNTLKGETAAINFYERTRLLFSAPASGAQLYYIGRTVTFPTVNQGDDNIVQPLRSDIIKSFTERYGRPTLINNCTDGSELGTIIFYTYKDKSIVNSELFREMDSKEFSNKLDKIYETLMKRFQDRRVAAADLQGYYPCWNELGTVRDRSEFDRSLGPIPSVIAVRLVRGSTPDYVKELRINMFDEEIFTKSRQIDQEYVEQEYARSRAKGAKSDVKAPL